MVVPKKLYGRPERTNLLPPCATRTKADGGCGLTAGGGDTGGGKGVGGGGRCSGLCTARVLGSVVAGGVRVVGTDNRDDEGVDGRAICGLLLAPIESAGGVTASTLTAMGSASGHALYTE